MGLAGHQLLLVIAEDQCPLASQQEVVNCLAALAIMPLVVVACRGALIIIPLPVAIHHQ